MSFYREVHPELRKMFNKKISPGERIDFFFERLQNEPFNKNEIINGFLEDRDPIHIEYVNTTILKERGYEIFECWGTKNVYTFLDNIEIYYKDKYYTLRYLYNYKDNNEKLVFRETLKLLFGGNDNWHKNTFIFAAIWDDENAFDILEFIRISDTPNPEDFDKTYYSMHINNLLFIDRDGYKVVDRNIVYREIEDRSLYDSLINLILNLSITVKSMKYHRDYLITLIYLATKHCFKKLSTTMEEVVDLIVDMDKFNFKIGNFYELFHIVFWYVLNGITFYDDDNLEIRVDDWFAIYKSFTRLVEFGASLGRKFVVPPYLKSLKYTSSDLSIGGQYGAKRRKYMFLNIQEKKDDFINPKRQILEVCIKLEYEDGDGMREARILLQEIFGILFLKTETISEITLGERVEYYTFHPWFDQDEPEECLELFEDINPRLEKMFLAGTLDPSPFIKGIRLFNELYTLLYIFPFIIEKKKTPDVEWDLKKEFEMLIFTSLKERKMFEKAIDDKKFKEEMTEEKLNSFKRWPDRKFSPIVIPRGAINWDERVFM